ncbi:MAG TPA: MATE family efflux transporter [Rhodoblastus sp.]|nr:MATE family efflux transporter [Rhodoblastus sp.]
MPHPLLTAPIGATLFRLAGPTTALMLVQVLVAVADAYFVGRLGMNALAGIALVIPFSTLMANIANGAMGGGVAASMARALGAGRLDDARAIVVHALGLALAFGLLFAALDRFAARSLFRWLGGDGDALAQALGFSHVWFAGAVAIWASAFLAALLRGAGDAATPSLYGLWASAFYIPMAGVLTLGVGGWPGLGLAGSAIASLVVATATALALARALLDGRLGFVPAFRGVRLRPEILGEILRVGGMGSLTTITANVTAMLVTGLVGRFGVSALAGYGVGARLEFMVAPVAFGIGSGLTTMVGIAAGAGRWRRAIRATWVGGATAFAVVGLIGWTVALLPDAWSRLFTSDDAVISVSVAYIRTVAPFYCFFGLGLVLHFASQGAGRMAVPVAAGVARLLVATVGGWMMVHHTDYGLAGVFAAIAAGLLTYGCLISGALLAAPWGGRESPKGR